MLPSSALQARGPPPQMHEWPDRPVPMRDSMECEVHAESPAPSDQEHESAELRRGVITLAVLLALRKEGHGYGVQTALSRIGITVRDGTLYPLLRRLEENGALVSRWDESIHRPRKFYVLTAKGTEALASLKRQYMSLCSAIEQLDRASLTLYVA